MAEPFLSEIRLFSFNIVPKGWAQAAGQFLPINQNQALFSLLGTTYGGDGRTNFALPDLRGRVPVHFGNGLLLGESAGSTIVTVTTQQIPTHTHTMNAVNIAADSPNPAFNGVGHLLAAASIWSQPNNLVGMSAGSVTNTGGSQPHTNMQPYLTLSFCIALLGIFPSQN